MVMTTAMTTVMTTVMQHTLYTDQREIDNIILCLEDKKVPRDSRTYDQLTTNDIKFRIVNTTNSKNTSKKAAKKAYNYLKYDTDNESDCDLTHKDLFNSDGILDKDFTNDSIDEDNANCE
jgi:hypothetical protein